MKYMLLIYSDENHYAKMSEQEMGELMAEYGKFHGEVESSGCLITSHRLRPCAMSTSVRTRSGESMATDGPFAETKEQFGGYYLIEAGNLDEAIEWAKKIPTVHYGTIEVRPVWEDGEE